jgi:hypothetical protein
MNFHLQHDRDFIKELLFARGITKFDMLPVQMSQRELALNIKPTKTMFFGQLSINSDAMANNVGLTPFYAACITMLQGKIRFQHHQSRFQGGAFILFDDILMSDNLMNTVTNYQRYIEDNPTRFQSISQLDVSRPIAAMSFVGYKINFGGA